MITVDTETGFVDGLVENDDSTHTLHITRAFAGAALEVEKDEDMAAHECASLRAPSGDNSTRRLRELGDGHGDGDAHAHTHVIDPTSHSRILGFGGPTGRWVERGMWMCVERGNREDRLNPYEFNEAVRAAPSP